MFWRADGSAFDAQYTSHPIEEQGVVQDAVATLVDITQRREAQARALLRRTNALLESRVAQRTAELQASTAHLRELANHGETVREQERTRIAREIHDELGSLLVPRANTQGEPPEPCEMATSRPLPRTATPCSALQRQAAAQGQ